MVLSIVSLVVAFFTLAFSIFVYLAHDRELKSQERKINLFQLNSLERQENETKKAIIRGSIIPSQSKGCRVLTIFNAGQSMAKNVRVEWLNPDSLVTVQWKFGLIGDMTPQNGRSFNIVLCGKHEETMRLRYTWADDYQANNVFEEDVQL